MSVLNFLLNEISNFVASNSGLVGILVGCLATYQYFVFWYVKSQQTMVQVDSGGTHPKTIYMYRFFGKKEGDMFRMPIWHGWRLATITKRYEDQCHNVWYEAKLP